MARALILIRFAAARTHFSRSPSGQLGSPWPLVAFAARPGVRVAGLDVFVCCFVVCLLLRPTSERASPDRALALLPAALPAGWGGGATLAPLLLLFVVLVSYEQEAPPNDNPRPAQQMKRKRRHLPFKFQRTFVLCLPLQKKKKRRLSQVRQALRPDS